MIAILTDPGVGGTFLNWTIHYLAGDSKYFSAVSNKFIDLTDNPIAGQNAHNFRPNQPRNLNEFDRIHNALLNAHNNSTIYFHNFHGSSLLDNSNTQTAIDKISTTATRIVVVELGPEYALYQCSYTPRSNYAQSFLNHSQILSDPDAIFDDFINYFFSESKQRWNTDSLTDIWDKREFIALNINPFNVLHVTDNINLSVPCYRLDAVDLMTNFDQLVTDLFEYLGVDLCTDRLEHWLSVYTSWKTLHSRRLNFVQQFDTIVDNIISGNEMDLECFNLDIRQEAAIQYQLLHRHNLNLKTWQLTKFVNTQQLHELLEPNIYHDLSKTQT
jgi:hypothetical protein